MRRLFTALATCVLAIVALATALGANTETQAVPAAAGQIQGDVDCANGVTGADALNVLVFASGITNTETADVCPKIGLTTVGGFPWGDTNCSGATDPADIVPILRFVSGLPPSHRDGCVDVGQPIGGPTPSPSPTPNACSLAGWTVGSGSSAWTCSSASSVSVHVTDGNNVLFRGETLSDLHIEATVSTTDREASFIFRAQDAYNGYQAIFEPNGIPPFSRGVWLYKTVNALSTKLASSSFSGSPMGGDPASLVVDATGTHITVKLNGSTLIDTNDSTYTTGKLGLRAFGDSTYPCDSTWTNFAYH